MANAQHIRPVSGSGEEVNIEIDDTRGQRHPGESEAGHQSPVLAPVLVLSRDPALLDTVRKAAPRGVSVTSAPDLDQVADKLPLLKPGVLIADTGSTSDVAALVAQLTQHFPELVVVVAGKREDSAGLMQLTAAGRIFRFLLTPLTHGQTRLALEAAVAQHADLRAAGQRLSAASTGDSGGKNYVMTYGALAAGLLIVIGGIWFGVKQFTREPEAPPAAVTAPANSAQPGGVPDKPDPVQAELALAKEALDQGKLLEPAGESALDLYRSAQALDPNSEAAKAGIRAVADRILGRAEAALTAEHLEEAIRNIEIARDIDATHPRLTFLDTQIARERERLKLSQAQEVGNRVRTLVAQANERIENGRLITPVGSSARDALIDARRLDPTDPTVAQSIRDLSAALAEEARKSLAAGKIDEAQTYVNGARQLGSAGAALAAVERSLTDATRVASAAAARRPASGPNTDSLVTDVRQRLTDGKLIDPSGGSAKDALLALRDATPNRPEVEELSRALSARLINSSKQAMAAKAYDRSAQLLAAAREVGARYNEATIAQAEHELTGARELTAQESSVVSAAVLKRTKMVNPAYPETALKRGIEGWVELAFTVTPKGTVEGVEVRNSSPAATFDEVAIRALRQWRFEPVERNGEKVAQRAMVRLRFTKPE
ncbi:MAG TPA: energy transducer TonB [Steroidobacteraceae bacterium]